jgi:hypothetical protein
VLVYLASACGGGSSSARRDAGPGDAGAVSGDAGPAGDGAVPLLWVDFSIAGCRSSTGAGTDADAGVGDACVATAPARLRFSAVAPAIIEVYRWNFGDGSSEVQDGTPEHEFRLPGTYDVSLVVGGPGGTASSARLGAVRIEAAPLGAACAEDVQCRSSLCICGPGSNCPAGLGRGICAAACTGGACAEGTCVDLAPSAPPDPGEWQRQLCLPGCDDPGACPSGLLCRELRAPGGGWRKACFPAGVLGDLGGRCLDPQGQPDHAACTSGLCMAEGAYGMCAASCAGGAACPSQSACATFNTALGGLSQLCIAACTGPDACTLDPWLGCEAPGRSGTKGFSVAVTPHAGGYCAPRSCSSVQQCGGAGSCQGGFCAP